MTDCITLLILNNAAPPAKSDQDLSRRFETLIQKLESSEKERQSKSAQETCSKQAEFLSEISKRMEPKFTDATIASRLHVSVESALVQELKEVRAQLEAVKTLAETQSKQAEAVQCESKAAFAKMEQLSSAHLDRLLALNTQALQHVTAEGKQAPVLQNSVDPAITNAQAPRQQPAIAQIQHTGPLPQIQSFPAVFPPQYQFFQPAQPVCNTLVPQGNLAFANFHDTIQRQGPFPGYDQQIQVQPFEGLVPQSYPVCHSYQHPLPVQRASFSGTANLVSCFLKPKLV